MNAKIIWLLFLPLLASCSEPYSIRFPDRAFPTQPNQKVIINTARGKTEVRGVIGSRDIVVRGTVETTASSMESAVQKTEAVKVIDTSTPRPSNPILRLDVIGTSPYGETRLNAEFLVPKDILLEVHDGPDDLAVSGLDQGVDIEDGAGYLTVSDVNGPVTITDQDGDLSCSQVKGPLKVDDRRGAIIAEEITGNVEIVDREDDALIQSVTGDLTMSKLGRGTVRINNVDGKVSIQEWDNPIQPIIDTIWSKEAETQENPPAAASGSVDAGKPVPSSGKVEKVDKGSPPPLR